MNYILFEDSCRTNLLPLTFTRPVPEIRIGILTIREKWEYYLHEKCSFLTEKYLSKKFKLKKAKDNILINGSVFPNKHLVKSILSLQNFEALICSDTIIAVRLEDKELSKFQYFEYADYKLQNAGCEIKKINNLWDIFSINGDALSLDFELITKGRNSSTISNTNTLLGNNIFIEEGAKVECSILNSTTGLIYIGKNAEIMEGSIVRGPFALCENSTLKMGAKIYGPTTIGPYSKIGGEVNNSIIFGYSNKAHDGFLGNSVIGEWCNIGADTNNSNLKNNYENVKLWNYETQSFVDTGLQFCGLILGDHSKCGINTMFNTGTVVGVSSNIFGDGFPRNFIPSFYWGGARGFVDYRLDKAINTAKLAYQRRGMKFDQIEQDIFKYLFEHTQKYKK